MLYRVHLVRVEIVMICTSSYHTKIIYMYNINKFCQKIIKIFNVWSCTFCAYSTLVLTIWVRVRYFQQYFSCIMLYYAVSSTPRLIRIGTHNVSGDWHRLHRYKCSYKSNYHTITITTTLNCLESITTKEVYYL